MKRTIYLFAIACIGIFTYQGIQEFQSSLEEIHSTDFQETSENSAIAEARISSSIQDMSGPLFKMLILPVIGIVASMAMIHFSRKMFSSENGFS